MHYLNNFHAAVAQVVARADCLDQAYSITAQASYNEISAEVYRTHSMDDRTQFSSDIIDHRMEHDGTFAHYTVDCSGANIGDIFVWADAQGSIVRAYVMPIAN